MRGSGVQGCSGKIQEPALAREKQVAEEIGQVVKWPEEIGVSCPFPVPTGGSAKAAGKRAMSEGC